MTNRLEIISGFLVNRVFCCLIRLWRVGSKLERLSKCLVGRKNKLTVFLFRIDDQTC